MDRTACLGCCTGDDVTVCIGATGTKVVGNVTVYGASNGGFGEIVDIGYGCKGVVDD